MSHTTEIVNARKESGQVRLTIRCCGNPSTDFVHTMLADAFYDPEKRAESIAGAHKQCAKQHEASLTAENVILEEVGKTVRHD